MKKKVWNEKLNQNLCTVLKIKVDFYLQMPQFKIKPGKQWIKNFSFKDYFMATKIYGIILWQHDLWYTYDANVQECEKFGRKELISPWTV